MDPVPVEGAGSGFVIDERGYILTNFHVVQEAQSIEVVLGDRTRYPAKFIGADQRNDVAMIKIDPKGKTLAALPLGDSSKLQVGQKVLAIGNPSSRMPVAQALVQDRRLIPIPMTNVRVVRRGNAALRGGPAFQPDEMLVIPDDEAIWASDNLNDDALELVRQLRTGSNEEKKSAAEKLNRTNTTLRKNVAGAQ